MSNLNEEELVESFELNELNDEELNELVENDSSLRDLLKNDNNLKRKNSDEELNDLIKEQKKDIIKSSIIINNSYKKNNLTELKNTSSLNDEKLLINKFDDTNNDKLILNSNLLNIEDENITKENIKFLCNEKIENKYHNVKFMESLTIMENEINLMNKIIKILKEIEDEDDIDIYENKKFNLQSKINNIKIFIENEQISTKDYLNKVIKCQKTQKIFLEQIDKDDSCLYKNYNKKRIEERINLMENEINELNEIIKNENEEDEKNNNENLKKSKLTVVEISKNNSIIVPIITDQNKIKILKSKALDLKNEYLLAKRYFQENNFQIIQKEECEKILNKLDRIIKNLENNRNVDENDFPDSISPQFIFGTTIKERNEKFMKILHYLQAKKLEYEEKLMNYKNNLRLLPKTTQKIELKKLKILLENLNNSKIYYEFMLKKYMEAIKNSWVPCPNYIETEKIENIEKLNSKLDLLDLKISIFNLQGISKNFFGSILINLNTKNSNIEYEIPIENRNISYEKIYRLKKNEKNKIFRQIFFIYLKENGKKSCFSCFNSKDKIIGYLEISLNDFKFHNTISGTFNFVDPNNKKNILQFSCEVNLQIYKALNQQEFETITKKEIEILQIYQPFKGEPIKDYEKIKSNSQPILKKPDLPKNLNEIDSNFDLELNEDIKRSVQNIKIKKKQNNNVLPKLKENVNYDLNEFSENEIFEPEIPEKFPTLKTLEHLVTILEERIKKIDGRTPKELLTKFNKISCQAKIMKDMIENGDIQIEDYLNLIKMALNHDEKLRQYFYEENNEKKIKIVNDRIIILTKELKEVMDAYKKMK